MTTQVFLPAHLADWIERHMPLSNLDKVRFRLRRRIPFWWLMPNRSFSGLTLWNRVYVVQDYWRCEPVTRPALELVLHELVHVAQYRKNPFTFPVRYLINHFRFGYDRNPAEVEARDVASRLAASFFEARI